METERVERLWQAVMNVAVAMKKDGLDTGDAVRRLRDAKVLLNHCIYDEHAHGEELFEAEMEIEGIQRDLMSILEKEGRERDFSFEIPPQAEKRRAEESHRPPAGLSRTAAWAKIRLPKEMDIEEISKIEGVRVIEKDNDNITITGERSAIQKALDEISKVFLG